MVNKSLHLRLSLVKNSFFILTLILLLTSCGTPQNKGEPSAIRDLKFEIQEGGVNFTWKSPDKNFNYVEEVTNSESQGRSLNSFVFYVKGQSHPDKIAQIKGQKDYSYFVKTEDLLASAEFSGIRLFAKNDVYDNGGPVEDVSIDLPKVTDPPDFKKELVERFDVDANLGDRWIEHKGKSSIKFCDFMETDWKNRVEIIKISLTGAAVASKIMTGEDYFREGCVYVYADQFKKGIIKYKILVRNNFGSRELQGTFRVTNPYKYSEPSISPESNSNETPPMPTKVDPWTRTWSSRQLEEIAKTTWCIEQGYRNYIYSKDVCTNTLSR